MYIKLFTSVKSPLKFNEESFFFRGLSLSFTLFILFLYLFGALIFFFPFSRIPFQLFSCLSLIAISLPFSLLFYMSGFSISRRKFPEKKNSKIWNLSHNVLRFLKTTECYLIF